MQLAMLLLIGGNMKTRTIEREIYTDSFLFRILKENQISDINKRTIAMNRSSDFEHKAKIIIEVEEEPLTFEKIKKECVPMETKFISPTKGVLLYIGFLKVSFQDDELLVRPLGSSKDVVHPYSESEIKDWSICDEK